MIQVQHDPRQFQAAVALLESRIEELLPSVSQRLRDSRCERYVVGLVQMLAKLGLGEHVREISIYRHRKQQACIALLSTWVRRLRRFIRILTCRNNASAVGFRGGETESDIDGSISYRCGENNHALTLPQKQKYALLGYQFACEKFAAAGRQEPTDREAHDYILSNSPAELVVPRSFSTWRRSLGRARKQCDARKRRRKLGNATRSIVEDSKGSNDTQEGPNAAKRIRCNPLEKVRENVGVLFEAAPETRVLLMQKIINWLDRYGVNALEISCLNQSRNDVIVFAQTALGIVERCERRSRNNVRRDN
jgi:hypothetical protein